MFKRGFEGWYYKHQIGDKTLAFIPGRAREGAFVQVVTHEGAWHFPVPTLSVHGDTVAAGKCRFGPEGSWVDLPGIHGHICYGALTPLKGDIMGPFGFLPMECRHGVISMRHALQGEMVIQGSRMVLDGGVGYIEKDSGYSFPSAYLWLQCNDFSKACSIMVAIARIPMAGLHFTGCICAATYQGREYRLATYKGVRIRQAGPACIDLEQGKIRLRVDITGREEGQALRAPIQGRMTGRIRECNRASARFRLWDGGQAVFDMASTNVSLECVGKMPDKFGAPTRAGIS
nr:tocopherol cyclase family protein [bacterium]